MDSKIERIIPNPQHKSHKVRTLQALREAGKKITFFAEMFAKAFNPPPRALTDIMSKNVFFSSSMYEYTKIIFFS